MVHCPPGRWQGSPGPRWAPVRSRRCRVRTHAGACSVAPWCARHVCPALRAPHPSLHLCASRLSMRCLTHPPTACPPPRVCRLQLSSRRPVHASQGTLDLRSSLPWATPLRGPATSPRSAGLKAQAQLAANVGTRRASRPWRRQRVRVLGQRHELQIRAHVGDQPPGWERGEHHRRAEARQRKEDACTGGAADYGYDAQLATEARDAVSDEAELILAG